MTCIGRSLARLLLPGALGIAALAAAPLAQANLISLGNLNNVPGGVGNSGTILSVSSQGNSSGESGGIGIFGGVEACDGPDIQGNCGSANNPLPLRTLGAAGIDSAQRLVIAFDAQEPDNAITLNALTLNLFQPAGVGNGVLFTASYVGDPLSFATCPGQGNNCVHAFALDEDQAEALQDVFDADARIGLIAELSNATGGPDRFFLFRAQLNQVPEPTSLALLALAMLGLGLVRRRG